MRAATVTFRGGNVSADSIDLVALLRASQALSSETSVEQLKARVVELLGTLTGATQVLLVLYSEEPPGWFLSTADQNAVTVEEAAAAGLLPLSAFRYAERTREVLLVDDVANDDRFACEPHFAGLAQCSLLAVPILNQGSMRAMLLLESRLRRGAFSADRLDAIMLIAGQLAVSLENALLYASLERKVAERTRELEKNHKELRALDSLIEHMDLAFVSGGRDCRIMRANAAFSRLTGYSADELLQMKTTDLTPERWRAADAERFRVMIESGLGAQGEKEYLRKDGSLVPVSFHSELYRNASQEADGLCAFVTDLTETKRRAAQVERVQSELRESEARLRAAFDFSAIGIILTTPEGQPLRANRAFCSILGYSEAELVARNRGRTTHPDHIEAEGALRKQLLAGEIPSYILERRQIRKDGHIVWVRSTVSPARGADGEILHLVYEIEDITDRKRAEAELEAASEQKKKLEMELLQAQKLESVGRLAAGVAHEINTPVQFINDSCHFVRDGLADLRKLLADYRGIVQALAEGATAPQAALEQMRASEDAADLGYLLENMPDAIDRSLEGLERVTTIVRSMKEFAHPAQKERVAADINQAILSTLTIARNEYKYVADVRTDLGELPAVPCYPGELNQAVLNIVINAAHAIEDVVRGTEQRGLITIRTRREGRQISISIHDTGGGIPQHVRDKIFDPFFTTKEVGKGTGQGLAIARSVVVQKHRGTLDVDTHPGQGSTFTIRLPIDPAEAG